MRRETERLTWKIRDEEKAKLVFPSSSGQRHHDGFSTSELKSLMTINLRVKRLYKIGEGPELEELG